MFDTIISDLLGLPKWVRQALAIVTAALALWGLWTIWLHIHDEGVRNELDASVIAASQAATDIADQNDAVRQLNNAIASERTKAAIAQAEASHPAETKAAAGPASRAALDSLRHRGK